MPVLEIEYKTLLNQEEYQKLVTEFSSTPSQSQTNYYFDTPSQDMKRLNQALRIRHLSDTYELTLKIPQTVGNLEYNQTLSPTESSELLEKSLFPEGLVKDILLKQQFPIKELQCLGSLKTDRKEIALPFGLLAIDQSEYLGQIDFELELEVSDASRGKDDFQRFLKERQITYKPSPSKIARFANQLNTQS